MIKPERPDLFTDEEVKAAQACFGTLRMMTDSPQEGVPALALLVSYVLDTQIKDPRKRIQAVADFKRLLDMLLLAKREERDDESES